MTNKAFQKIPVVFAAAVASGAVVGYVLPNAFLLLTGRMVPLNVPCDAFSHHFVDAHSSQCGEMIIRFDDVSKMQAEGWLGKGIFPIPKEIISISSAVTYNPDYQHAVYYYVSDDDGTDSSANIAIIFDVAKIVRHDSEKLVYVSTDGNEYTYYGDSDSVMFNKNFGMSQQEPTSSSTNFTNTTGGIIPTNSFQSEKPLPCSFRHVPKCEGVSNGTAVKGTNIPSPKLGNLTRAMKRRKIPL